MNIPFNTNDRKRNQCCDCNLLNNKGRPIGRKKKKVRYKGNAPYKKWMKKLDPPLNRKRGGIQRYDPTMEVRDPEKALIQWSRSLPLTYSSKTHTHLPSLNLYEEPHCIYEM